MSERETAGTHPSPNFLEAAAKEVGHFAQDVGHAFTDNAKTAFDSHASAGARVEAGLHLVEAGATVVAVTAAVVLATPEEGVAAVAVVAVREGAEVGADLAAREGTKIAIKSIAKNFIEHAGQAFKSGVKAGQDFMHGGIGRGLESMRAGYDVYNDTNTIKDPNATLLHKTEAVGAAALDVTGLGGAARGLFKDGAEFLKNIEKTIEHAPPRHIAATVLSKVPTIIRKAFETVDHKIGQIEHAGEHLHKDLEHAPEAVRHIVHKAEYLGHEAAHFEHAKGLGEDAIALAKGVQSAPEAIAGAQHKAEHKVAPFLENLALQGVQGFEHVAQKVADGANTAVHAAKSVESKLEFLKSLNENHLPSENHKQHNGVAHHMPGQAQHHNQGHAHGGR